MVVGPSTTLGIGNMCPARFQNRYELVTAVCAFCFSPVWNDNIHRNDPMLVPLVFSGHIWGTRCVSLLRKVFRSGGLILKEPCPRNWMWASSRFRRGDPGLQAGAVMEWDLGVLGGGDECILHWVGYERLSSENRKTQMMFFQRWFRQSLPSTFSYYMTWIFFPLRGGVWVPSPCS